MIAYFDRHDLIVIHPDCSSIRALQVGAFWRTTSAAMRYRTLTDAADSLGIDQVTLQNQINRIESELGTKLFIRAERCQPMRLTDDGAQVVATVRACQRRGW